MSRTAIHMVRIAAVAICSVLTAIPADAQRQVPRPFGCFALFDQFADAHFNMKGELGVDVSERFEAKQPSEARPSRHGVIT